MKKRYIYSIEGIVQGVGFRPFIYTLAKRYGLKGYVLNDSEGVKIDIEGEARLLVDFDNALLNELPSLARVDFIDKKEIKNLALYEEFIIKSSSINSSKKAFVSPDMSICEDCLKELEDKNNRRFNYPFINCTNCGPRYSIIKALPYDRINTSMSDFIMCDDCKKEYENPLDRRYHAQPVSCDVCGPELFLKKITKEIISKNYQAIEEIVKIIQNGDIVAIKGMGGFHLVCDATNSKALKELRDRKRRPTKPFAVMFPNIEEIKKEVELSLKEEEEITSIKRPIVLVKRKTQSSLSNLVAPKIDRLGVFLPYTPLHVILLKLLKKPIVATSANQSGDPIVTNEYDLLRALNSVIDYYLDYNREIVNSSDDSVLQIIDNKTLFIRSSRGYNPLGFSIKSRQKRAILAVGAHQKSTISLYFDNQVVFSPYIGDLQSVKSCELFERVIENFKRFYSFEPDLIVCDKHLGYHSTKWALSQGVEVVQIQHHYAHILATMFEHKIDKKVLGVAWDGTGYGDDKTIWGGEFFVCDKQGYERVAYFEPFLLLGGEGSIKDIKRVALSFIFDIAKDEEDLKRFDEFLKLFSKSELSLLKQIYKKELNSPKCSSVGRIFDAVAVFSGVCSKVSYDGESGLIVESLYDKNIKESYDIYLDGDIIRYKHIFFDMLRDKEPKIIATKFINALANIIFKVSKRYDLDVILSGGVFQNRTLLELLFEKEKNFIIQTKTPINDSSISLGQLYKFL